MAALNRNLLWSDDIGISAFHSCDVSDLWQSFPEWLLLLSVCALVCHCENDGARIREMPVLVYGENAMKKTAVYKCVMCFSEEKKVSLMKRDQDGQQQAELKKALQKFVKLYVKVIG
jgi:hypothetical protein